MKPSARQIRRQLCRGARTLNRCQTKQSRNRTRNDSIQDFLPAIKSKDEGTEKPDNSFARKHSARGYWRFARTEIDAPDIGEQYDVSTASFRSKASSARNSRTGGHRRGQKIGSAMRSFRWSLDRASCSTSEDTNWAIHGIRFGTAARGKCSEALVTSSTKSQGFEFQKDQDGER
jgi:hypothetical protein